MRSEHRAYGRRTRRTVNVLDGRDAPRCTAFRRMPGCNHWPIHARGLASAVREEKSDQTDGGFVLMMRAGEITFTRFLPRCHSISPPIHVAAHPIPLWHLLHTSASRPALL